MGVIVMTFRKRTDRPESAERGIIYSCCLGEVKSLDRISEDLFPSLFVGDGFCILPTGNIFVCPVKGVIKDISENGMDITIKTSDGLILIVSLGKEGGKAIKAEVCVQRGDIVPAGAELWKTDGIDGSLVCVVVVTNCNGKDFKINYGRVKQLDQPIMKISI